MILSTLCLITFLKALSRRISVSLGTSKNSPTKNMTLNIQRKDTIERITLRCQTTKFRKINNQYTKTLLRRKTRDRTLPLK